MKTELDIQKEVTDNALVASWKALLEADYYPTSVKLKERITYCKTMLKEKLTPHQTEYYQTEITRLQSILYPPQTLAS